MNNIQLAHGSGGQAMQQLINSLFMEAFANPWLAEQEDQARLDLAQLVAEGDRLAFSTDSYVIDPLFFPGGNIGKLAICGTANDVAVSGAIPRYLSCGFILEEGLPMETLKAVVTSMAETARTAGIAIVTGDTKVVQRGAETVYQHRWHGRNSGEYSLGRTDANRRRCIAGERYTRRPRGDYP